MNTATLFMNGGSQAVRIPKKFRFEGTRVVIKKMGTSLILTPYEDDPWASLKHSIEMFSDDFMEDREQPEMQERDLDF